MADIFIAYSSTDYKAAKLLFDVLSQSWDVWWDYSLVGNYDEKIEREIPKAQCLVSILTNASRNSEVMKDEWRLANKHNVEIIPAKLEECDAPLGFYAKSYVELFDWNGGTDHPGIKQLQAKISSLVAPRTAPKRPKETENGQIELPAVFLSVSSHETRIKPLNAVQVLSAFNVSETGDEPLLGNPTILLSAYDLVEMRYPEKKIAKLEELRSELGHFRDKRGFIMIDSGNYEAKRLADKTWNRKLFEETLRNTPHDCALSFDYHEPPENLKNWKREPLTGIEEIVKGVQRDQKLTTKPIVPIIHSPVRDEGGHNLEQLPTIVRKISERFNPPLIAIPERELGPGLIECARAVRKIREELNKLPFYQPIHLLGTGNPWSITVYTAAGADSFDGLEWCRMVVDRRDGRLYHVQQFSIFKDPMADAISEITKLALRDVKDGGLDYAGKIAFHNLDYFSDFSRDLRQYAINGKSGELVTYLLVKDNVDRLKYEMPELFQ